MDNFEDKLNAVLNDPAAMEKVVSLARSLGGGSENTGDGGESRTHDTEEPDGNQQGITESLGLPAIDPAMLNKLMGLWKVYNQGSDPQKMAVLHAVKPYLHPDRQQRVDRALQTLRLAHVAREVLGTDLFGALLGGKR